MELVSIAIELTLASGEVLPMKNTTLFYPSHILFADDVLFFCKASPKSFKGIKNMLHVLSSVSGLTVNFDKSKVYMSKRTKNKLSLSQLLGIPMGTLPIKYMGLPLSSSYPKSSHFQPLIDSCRRRLEGWGGRALSVAGRAQLISSVLQNIANFWIMSFKLPSSVLRTIDSMFSNFF